METKYESAMRYVASCRRWREEHPMEIKRHPRLAFYPVPGCRIFVGRC